MDLTPNSLFIGDRVVGYATATLRLRYGILAVAVA